MRGLKPLYRHQQRRRRSSVVRARSWYGRGRWLNPSRWHQQCARGQIGKVASFRPRSVGGSSPPEHTIHARVRKQVKRLDLKSGVCRFDFCHGHQQAGMAEQEDAPVSRAGTLQVRCLLPAPTTRAISSVWESASFTRRMSAVRSRHRLPLRPGVTTPCAARLHWLTGQCRPQWV